jgi:hypothetical protein
MNLPEYEAQELPHQLAVVLRRNGVLVKAIELDCAARQGRIVCSSIFDVTKLLALSGQKLRYSELFFWSDYAGVGDLIDPALQYKERVDGSLLVVRRPHLSVSLDHDFDSGSKCSASSLLKLSCSQPEAPQTWIDYRHDPKSLVAELEKRFPYRYLFRPLPRDGSDPGAGLIRLEVFPRDEDHPVSEIVEALHGRTLKGSRVSRELKHPGANLADTFPASGRPCCSSRRSASNQRDPLASMARPPPCSAPVYQSVLSSSVPFLCTPSVPRMRLTTQILLITACRCRASRAKSPGTSSSNSSSSSSSS